MESASVAPRQTAPLTWLDWLELALLPLGLVAYLAMPHGIGADGTARYQATQQLRLGHLTPSRYSIVQSILALPLYFAGETIEYPFGMVALFNTIVFLAGLAATAVLLRHRIPAPMLRRILLLLIAASMFGHHVQLFYGEVLTAVFVAVGLLCLTVGHSVLGNSLVVVGVVNTPAALPGMFLALFSRRPARWPWQAFWPTGLASVIVLTEFYLRRGSPFLTGYEGDGAFPPGLMPYSGSGGGFSYPLAFGVLGILFSFGKGLALFVPGLWLLFKRPVSPAPEILRLFQRSAIWFLVGLVLVYAKWWAWNGSWFWGPRFFLFACFPACVALAIHLCDDRAGLGAKALTLAALCWSIWVGVDGVAIGLSGLETCSANGYRLEFLCWYSIEFSALFRPFTVFPTVGLREGLVAAYFVVVGMVLAAPFAIDLAGAGVASLRRQLAAGPRASAEEL
jgi:hypothetical protein